MSRTTATKPRATTRRKTTKSAPVTAVDGTAPATATASEPKVVNAPQPVIMGPVMRKKELVDAVVARSGLKKKDVKPAIENLLVVLGEALADNRELVLPPMGRLKVTRSKDLANGRMIVAKIRQKDPKPDAETDAAAADAPPKDI